MVAAQCLANRLSKGIPSVLAARSRDVRTRLSLSIREAARRAELGESVVRSIESGRHPALDTVEAIAKALSVSPAWLAFGLGPQELPRRGLAKVGQVLEVVRERIRQAEAPYPRPPPHMLLDLKCDAPTCRRCRQSFPRRHSDQNSDGRIYY